MLARKPHYVILKFPGYKYPQAYTHASLRRLGIEMTDTPPGVAWIPDEVYERVLKLPSLPQNVHRRGLPISQTAVYIAYRLPSRRVRS